MAAFQPSFTIVQSYDGKSLLITDTSPWGTGNNNQNYERANFIRTFVLKSAEGLVITTIVLPVNSNISTYTITKNLWIETTFTVDGITDYTLTQKQLFDRFTAIAYRNAINEGKCCSSGKSISNIHMANIFLKGVDFSVPIGNGIDVQQFEDIAYSYLVS